MKFIFIISLIICTSWSQAEEKKSQVSQVWGQIVKVKKIQIFQGHRYFIYYVKDKKEYAYPIEIQNAQQEKMINAHINKLAKISGSIHSAKLEIDGPPSRYLYFVPKDISPLSLSELRPATLKKPMEKTPDELETTNYSAGGITISDDAANYAIFTASALLVGSIVKDLIEKK